jgi:ArsR family transcriptional regulator
MMNEVFKALADPTRRKILDLLKDGDLSAGEIAAKFSISKPSISNHLSILKKAKLVLAEKQGQFIIYSLNTTLFQDVIKWMLTMKGDN